MNFCRRLWLIRLGAAIALTGSAALMAIQLRYSQSAGRCGGGCGSSPSLPTVLIPGVALTVGGLAVFGGLLVLSLFPAWRVRRLCSLLALAAGGMGLGLILTQVFIFQTLCPLCLVVNSAALFVGVIEGVWGPANIAR
jgi:uncharacterized membrane protein